MSDAAEEIQESSNDDYLGMSDDDFANMDSNAFEDEAPIDEALEDAEDAASEEEIIEEEPEVAEELEPDTTDEEDTDPLNPEEEEEASEEKDESDTEEKKEESPEVDYQAFFEQITSEFKANGRNMKIDSAEDVVRLMQMGADYNRKMSALKPSRKVLKMLEKNQLLDEGKLSFLIDLDKKNPEAIAKLLADSKIDPMDLDTSEGDKYKSSDHSVDDREIALDSVVESLRDSEHYPQTIQVVSQQWDDASKQIVANEPQLLRVMHDHMASGVYDLISTEVEQERMFGRLDGMSDIEAYRKVGDVIAARGGFDFLSSPESKQQNKPASKVDKATKTKADKDRRDKRRAASPSKSAASGVTKSEDFNPLGMSDDDYLKQFDEKFL